MSVSVKSKLFNVALFFVLSIFLSGCATSYNIEPHYDKENKAMRVLQTKFNGVEEKLNRKSGGTSKGSGVSVKKNYSIADFQCKTLEYSSYRAGTNTYVTTSDYEKIIDWYIGGSCKVTSVANLKLMMCNGVYDDGDFDKGICFITTDTLNQWGYASTAYVKTNMACFEQIKNELIKQARIDKVEVENYIDKAPTPEDAIVYFGKVTVEKEFSKKDCPNGAKLKLLYSKKYNSTKGTITWTNASGTIGMESIDGDDKNLISGSVEYIIDSIDNQSIQGTLKSRGCKGFFEAKRQ